VKFEWTEECQKSFEKLRDALTSAPVLTIADPNKHYILHTDASDFAMGAILMQEDANGDLHVIAYASKTFNDAQKNYDTTDREALAVVWALEHFNTYCEGHKYTLLTDHQALSYIKSNKNEKKRIHRLALKLANYDVQLYYKPGKENHMADLLSRDYMVNKSEELPSNPIKKVTFAGLNVRKRNKRKQTQEEYEVEKIVDKRAILGRSDEYEYHVKWKGYPDSENTWEPAATLQNAIKIIVDYERKIERKNKIKTKDVGPKHLPEITQCPTCAKSFVNQSAFHIHNYHEHQVKVPSIVMSQMDINSNKGVFQKLQETEPQFRPIFNTDCGLNDYSELDKSQRRMLDQHEFVISDDGLLYCVEIPTIRTRSKLRTQLRLCIPASERSRILYKYHSEFSHCGVNRLYDMLCERVWWPRMLRDVVTYVRKCDLCQRSKGGINNVNTRSMELPIRPWSHVHFDHIGILPTTDNGNMYILTIVDRFTRYAEAFPVKDITAEETAKLLIEKVVCRYGMPEVLCSDRGPVMVGLVINQVFKILGIKRVKTSSHHAQSNGLVEIFNKTLKQSLRIWSKEHQRDWDELLPFALFAYNTSFHTLLRETPYYLNHGIQARDITDEIVQSDYATNASIHGYAKQLTEKLYKSHQRVRELLELVNEKREKQIQQEKPIQFEVGDQVLLYDPTTPVGISRKLVRRWVGPYTVIEKHSTVNYTIMKDSEQQKVNVKRLRLFKDFTDLQNVADLHETDLDIAKREIAAISNELQSLQARKQEIEAANDIQNNENNGGILNIDNVINANAMAVNVGVCCITMLDNIMW
jgi:hypothetical protein